MKVPEITKFLLSYKKFLTYHNVVEYVLPTIALLLLVYSNFLVLLKINLLDYMTGTFQTLVIPIFILFIVGWGMYTTRFYQLYPGYSTAKREFRIKIANIFSEHNKSNIEPYKFGKYIYQKYWDLMDDETKNRSLTLHVNWVFLVHIANSIMISFVVSLLILLIIFIDGRSISKLQIIFSLSHILFYLYFRRPANKNIKKANFNILQFMDRDSKVIVDNIPPTLERFINEID